MKKITYNSTLSVQENARINKVSESAIRKYIHDNGIDRRYDRTKNLINKCKDVFKKENKPSIKKVAEGSGCSPSFVQKYWTYISTGKEFNVYNDKKKELCQAKEPKLLKGKYDLMSSVIQDIPDVLKKADEVDVSALSSFLHSEPNKPMLFVGNGGAQGHYGAMLYGMCEKSVGIPTTPFMLETMSDETLRNSRTLLISSSGKNDDITFATNKLLNINPDGLGCITSSDNDKNEMLRKIRQANGNAFLFSEKLGKSGFISIIGKIYRNAILYRAFTGKELSGLKVSLNSEDCYSYKLNEGDHAPKLNQIKHLHVLYDGYGYPVAVDIESSMIESGMLSVSMCDYRNFCHGRFIHTCNHTASAKNPIEETDTAIVLLVSPKESNVVKRLLKYAIPAATPIIVIKTLYDSALATIDMQIKAQVLISDIGEKHLGINPNSPPNHSDDISKLDPINKVSFKEDFKIFGSYTATSPTDEIIFQLQEYIEQDRINTRLMEETQSLFPSVIKEDLYKIEPEQYNIARFQAIAFRRKDDRHKGEIMPYGNMNSGFQFLMNGIRFNTSEHAYIMGMFSNNTDDHIKIQKELAHHTNGFTAKKEIKQTNVALIRKDWHTFNVEWMLYVVWNKVNSSKKFRELLMSVPKGVLLIEDTTMQITRKENDTSFFWGCKNEELKQFNVLVGKYAKAFSGGVEAEERRIETSFTDNFCNIGVFIGHNTMGKILTYIKDCIHDNKEPDIDYELLKSKHIHFFGKEINFYKKLEIKVQSLICI